MEQLPLFDCSVVNDSLDKAVAEIMNIVAAEKRRRSS
jgi:guanylate kinase